MSASAPRVAIVGGGAVGQVYGLHLLAGGAEVTYFVRERYVDELRAGTTLHALPRGGSRKLVPTHVRADMTGLAEGFDQVWLCVPPTRSPRGRSTRCWRRWRAPSARRWCACCPACRCALCWTSTCRARVWWTA
ncbi:MAG: hypothetical protein IPG81_01860 [Sandaracinaceae bacterium]|nr:hypothetical protein [Sandaracinaceae bacterium]